ncbi:hypothetical protein Esti_006721 [Eimeria stiedai]
MRACRSVVSLALESELEKKAAPPDHDLQRQHVCWERADSLPMWQVMHIGNPFPCASQSMILSFIGKQRRAREADVAFLDFALSPSPKIYKMHSQRPADFFQWRPQHGTVAAFRMVNEEKLTVCLRQSMQIAEPTAAAAAAAA